MTRSEYSHRCYFFFLIGTMKNRTNHLTWIVLPIALFFLLSCATPEKKQSDSRDPKFYNNRGIAYAEKGQYDQAISDFSKAIEINPRYGKAYNNRGIVYRLTGRYDQAISDFNKAIEINPMDAQTHNNLAWLFATANTPSFRNGEKAVGLAQKACELSEWKNPGYLDTLAASYARVRDFGNATKWQEKALQLFEEGKKAEAQKRLNLYREHRPWPPD
jgi:Flp pilus assembly protein TadD